MKIRNYLAAISVVLGVVTTNAANATDWDWGGYVATADSPVIGGAVMYAGNCANYTYIGMGSSSCTEYYLDIKGFGLLAYSGTPTYGVALGGGTNRYRGLAPGCPANAARIDMSNGYKRADTGAIWDGVYNGYNGYKYLSTGASSFVCVKTDTY